MSVGCRNNVQARGKGAVTMVFSHGFGCDQNMWRFLAPRYKETFRTVLFDLVGSGSSDLSAYDRGKYDSLLGYADDTLEIIDAFAEGPVIFVGHSVSTMIGLLAAIKRPECISAHVMVGPSPCYVNDGDYVGGFTRADIDTLLETLENNYLGWSHVMAPRIMGAPGQPHLADELANSFCRTDPDIAAHFARVTFLSDNRTDVPRLAAPTLVLQCSDDIIAPRSVGDYLERRLPRGTLREVENVGHCPHMSAPAQCIEHMDAFLSTLGLGRGGN
ncbi:MAG: alpha/beta fold hydrolase [Rhodanobacteraceae bacterium]